MIFQNNNNTLERYDGGSIADNGFTGTGYGTCTTAEATTAKVAILANYELTKNGVTAIHFTNAVPASSTLNINSKGAKPIYYKGSALPSDIIRAGDTATFFYDGSYYHLTSVDRQMEFNFSTHTVYRAKTITTTVTENLGSVIPVTESVHVPKGCYIVFGRINVPDNTYKCNIALISDDNHEIGSTGNSSTYTGEYHGFLIIPDEAGLNVRLGISWAGKTFTSSADDYLIYFGLWLVKIA